jgi:hypothetical protein
MRVRHWLPLRWSVFDTLSPGIPAYSKGSANALSS